MIAAVGNADPGAGAREALQRDVRAGLEAFPSGAPVLVRARAGLSLLIGRAVREAGRKLVLLLPSQAALPAALPPRDHAAVGELLLLADQVRLLPFDPADRDACVSADERLIRGCGRVLAVWDGSPSSPQDPTAHLVAFARGRGLPVHVIHPREAR
ncbi:MAG: hypothetical protein FWE75_05340 [Actinomycetia bacterium]|nr:hypothetical protein [Actinomycetes bacterium]